MILTSRLLGPCMVTAEDEERPLLHNVCLRSGRAYGADGYGAVSVAIDDAPEGEVLISASALSAMAKTMRKPDPLLYGAPGYYEAELTEDGRLRARVNETEYLIDPYKSDKPYPNLESLKPSDPPTLTITFTTRLLRRMLQAMEAAGADMQVTMQLRDATTVVILQGEDADGNMVEGFVMPARPKPREGRTMRDYLEQDDVEVTP